MYRLTALATTWLGAVLLCLPHAVAASEPGGFEKAQRNEWHATTADFNGDDEIDYAWLERDNYGYCLLIAEVAGRQYVLTRSSWGGCGGLYVDTVAPGIHETACARGLGRGCRPDQLRSVTLEHTGLVYGQQEASGQLWYWTGDGFSEVWVSD